MPTSFRRLVVATLAAASGLAALARTDEGPSRVDPATREMAALLAEHAARVDPIRLTFVINDKRAEIIGGRLAVPRPSSERLPMRFLYATELQNAGRFRDAISELDGLAEDARTSEPQRWPRFYPAVTIQKAENVKEQIMARDEVARAAETAWSAAKRIILESVDDPSSTLRARIADTVVRFGESLRDDVEMRDKVDNWIVRGANHLVSEYGAEITTIITDTIERWDAEEASRRIELHVGRDLQFIRINGTVVGSLAGLVIYTVAQLLF